MSTKLITGLKSLAKSAGDLWFWRQSRAEFITLLNRYPSPSGTDIVAITKAYKGQGWYKNLRAYQVTSEFRRLIDHVQQQEPARILEIGTASGATLLGWCRIASELVISIDLPGGLYGGGYARQKQSLYRLFTNGRPHVALHLLRKNSQLPATRQEVGALLGSRQLDVLFIDGDHRLEGATSDFNMYRDLVRPGGLIIFHDILKHKHRPDCQVDRLWNQIRADYQHVEIVENPEQGWAGIGILQVADHPVD